MWPVLLNRVKVRVGSLKDGVDLGREGERKEERETGREEERE